MFCITVTDAYLAVTLLFGCYLFGLQELSVYLDICCLKYAAKIPQTASHPSRQYIPPILRTQFSVIVNKLKVSQ